MAVFGSCPDGAMRTFQHLRLPLVGFVVRGFRACVLLFEAFRKRCPGQISGGPKALLLWTSKGNVKEFFGSSFGRFRLVS